MLKNLPNIQHLKNGKRVQAIRSKVFEHMLKTRGLKYRTFLWHLRSFKYLAFAPTRGEFLESYYVLMRYLDDVVDGDAPLPEDHRDAARYLAEKIEFSKNPVNPKDEIDNLMLYCFELGASFDQDFRSETSDILGCLLFDARRKGKRMILSEADLRHHFYLLDIRGTVRATLKVFNDDPDKFRLLEPLGTACRHQYNIEDIESDLAVGYVNISKEDCARFNISPNDLHGMSSKLHPWLRHHAEEGMALLTEHHRILPQGNFSRFEKIVFKYVYEIPARRIFRKMLSKTPLKAVMNDAG